ncbi:putative cell survival pathways protein [Gaertneriomyces sp. JEL0708]|nr:putative cell survival pathways protein [Gaertneriomyces sp. JEL0708]
MAAITSTKVSTESLKWVLEPSSATEANTFYIHTNDGAFVIVQMAYSTMSWSPSIQVSAAFHGKDGSKKRHTATLSGSSFKPSDDRLSVKCENMAVTYLPEKKGYKVTLNAQPALIIDVEFQAVDDFIQVHDGKLPFKNADISSGYVSAQFIPKARVTGSVFVDGKLHNAAGFGIFVKAVQSKPQNVARWTFANVQNDTDSLTLYQFEMPDGYGFDFKQCSQGILVLDNKTTAVTLDNSATLLNKTYDNFSGYQIPSQARYAWSGKTSDGEPVKIQMEVTLKRLIDKIDLLSELPFLIRKFIQALITAPFVYQWVEDVTATVTVGSTTRTISGRLFHENAFLNPLPE